MRSVAIRAGGGILIAHGIHGPVDAGQVNFGDVIMAVRAGGRCEVGGMGDLLNVDVAVDAIPDAVNRSFIGGWVHMQVDLFAVDGLDPAGVVMTIEAAGVAEVILGIQGAEEEQSGSCQERLEEGSAGCRFPGVGAG